MKTIVTKPDGTQKEVKNLGWLLRHAGEVERITLSDRTDGARCGCVLTAELGDGTLYTSPFNSLQICLEWVKRRSLRHAEIRNEVTAFSTSNP